jgi:aspartate aminotransferase
MMAPAAGFYADPDRGKDQVRLAYVLEQEKLAQAVECLRVALTRYPRTVPVVEARAVDRH